MKVLVIFLSLLDRVLSCSFGRRTMLCLRPMTFALGSF